MEQNLNDRVIVICIIKLEVFGRAKDFLDIISALFTIIGALKVIARYTPWKWDDLILDFLDLPMRLLRKKDKDES